MKVGDKVVCVRGWNEDGFEIVKGDDYIIIDIFGQNDISGVVVHHGDERGFQKILFRKAQDNFTNALTAKLATEFIEQDAKVIETEREKVLNLNAKF